MTDHYTDELFSSPTIEAESVIFPISRLVVDPERFTDDKQEVMSKKGMGVVYTKTSDQKQLRRDISDQERKSLLNTYYIPHHKKLSDLVCRSLDSINKAIIIDAHSFPSVPLPYEFDQNPQRPDICIGTDSFHTPDVLVNKAKDIFSLAGYSVVLNQPFAGTYVPAPFYHNDPRVVSLMIEVNRNLYMDEITGSKNDNFTQIRDVLESLLKEVAKIIIQS